MRAVRVSFFCRAACGWERACRGLLSDGLKALHAAHFDGPIVNPKVGAICRAAPRICKALAKGFAPLHTPPFFSDDVILHPKTPVCVAHSLPAIGIMRFIGW